MSTIKQTVERQFSRAAEQYRISTVHAAGEDLAAMVAAASLDGTQQILDAGSGSVGSGAGTSFGGS